MLGAHLITVTRQYLYKGVPSMQIKKISAFLALALAVAAPLGTAAQRTPAPHTGSTHTKTAPKAGATVSYSGPVKGSPTGTTFILALRKGPVTVDASHAQVRYKGQFAKFEIIKGGTFVTVVGHLTGTTLQATTITINRLPGEKTAPKNPKGSTAPHAPGK